ncbi:MAG: alpha/beta hydrolase [Candidatus Dormiibacterota bacterium]
MGEIRIVSTKAGPVEIVQVPGNKPPALFFPGGHASASSDCGWELYTASGHEVISFSRPGYGATRVGALTAAQFVPLVRDVCDQLGIGEIAVAVGVSFGGLQAVHVATDPQLAAQRLALHSCAPSALPYPDTRAETIAGPLVFSPLLEGLVWSTVRRLVRSDSGLRRMMARLSRLPADQWWGELTSADKAEARTLFQGMRSGHGFINDLRQAKPTESATRRDAISRVECPTLITASRNDAGVSFAHAEEFAGLIPQATLAEIDAPTHLFWIGRGKRQAASVVKSFLARGSN